MPGLRAAAFVGVSVALIAGCAAIAGLSDLQKDDCAFGCDGGTDSSDAEEAATEAEPGGPDAAEAGQDTGDARSPGDSSTRDVLQPDSPVGVCTTGQTRCADGGVETCLGDGQWGSPMACASSTCSGGQCTGTCAQGQTECSGDGVQTCDSNGQWGAAVPCTNQACVNGQCSGVCTPGQVQCSGTDLQTCDATGQWQTSQTCPVACCNGTCVDTTSDPGNCGGCGVACGAGYGCGTSFTAFTGTQPPGWTANGNAIYDATDNVGQLTDPTNSESGTWIYDNAILVDAVTVQFDFYIGGGTGADGMGLMFETSGSALTGNGFGGLGMAGLTGFGVEIDEYDNMACLDDSANHIAIDSLTACSGGIPDSLVVDDSPGITVADGNWHTMVVQVVNGAFTVTTDGTNDFASYTPGGWANGNFFLGFAGGTGGENNYHWVRNVSVSFQTPHCF